MARGAVAGTLGVARAAAQPFNEHSQGLLAVLADYAAFSLSNAGFLYETSLG
jgi:hypothetical protein